MQTHNSIHPAHFRFVMRDPQNSFAREGVFGGLPEGGSGGCVEAGGRLVEQDDWRIA
jgi:hypothetical protein